jgi:MSHA biogenesis protein MshN
MVWQFRRNAIIIFFLIFINGSFADNSSLVTKEELPLSEDQQALINYDKGLELLNKSQEVEAAVLFKKALEIYPKCHKARIQLVQFYKKIGWIDEVEKLLQTGLDLNPEHEDFIKNIAIIYNQKGHARKALSVLLTMPEYNCQKIDYLALLALTYLNSDQPDMAEKHYQQLLSFNKENSIWWLGLAVSQDVSGKYKNALESFNQAKTLGRFNSETLEYINNKLEQIKQHY